MDTSFRKHVRNFVNRYFGLFGYELVRTEHNFQNFINFHKTISNAKSARLSVGEYIDLTYNVPGATQLTINKMMEFGVFQESVDRVCEIGPGSGRYLEKTIEICHPKYYEIYETSKYWRNWLKNRYHVITHKADGFSLTHTKSHSTNVVQSHKVFPGLRVFNIIGYFSEMIRVCAPSGYIVFDLLCEDCLNLDLLPNWLESGVKWPCAMIPKQFLIDFFIIRGYEMTGDFAIKMAPGITHYFVFHCAN